MASYTPKAWENEPSEDTPISASALIDVEQRLANWASFLGPTYNVKINYDAVGDGVSDDTDNIQAAIDDASAAGGGTVYVPAGIYKLTSQLSIPRYVGILGDGQYTTQFACYNIFSGLKYLYQTGANSGRGGYSGSFRINMRETSVIGFHAELNVNRNFRDIRIDNPATNGTAMHLDDCQNCTFVGTDLEAKGGGGGPSGTKGVTFDKGASANWFYGFRSNEFTDYHVGFRHTADSWSGVDKPRHNGFWGIMIERGNATTTKLVYGRAGADNQFHEGNFASPDDPDPGADYPLLVFDNTTGDTGNGNPRFDTWKIHNVKFNGVIFGGARKAIAIQALGPYHYGIVRDCTIGNVKYFMEFDNYSHYIKEKDNFVDPVATARYKSPDGYGRANFLSSTAPTPERSRYNYFYVGGSGDLSSIPGTVETGYTIVCQFYVSRTLKHGTGNLDLLGNQDKPVVSGDVIQFVWDGKDTWHETGWAPAVNRAKGFISHGSVAGTARPSGFASVEWQGTIEPINMAVGDTWIDTS